MEHPLFVASFAEGYSFRNVIGTTQNETPDVTMVLTPLSIKITFMNTGRYALHQIEINTEELRYYSYNFVDDNGEPLSMYHISFNTEEMFKATKSIGRRDGIQIYLLKSDNQLSIQPLKSGVKDPGVVEQYL